jgi:hypothetical protein
MVPHWAGSGRENSTNRNGTTRTRTRRGSRGPEERVEGAVYVPQFLRSVDHDVHRPPLPVALPLGVSCPCQVGGSMRVTWAGSPEVPAPVMVARRGVGSTEPPQPATELGRGVAHVWACVVIRHAEVVSRQLPCAGTVSRGKGNVRGGALESTISYSRFGEVKDTSVPFR